MLAVRKVSESWAPWEGCVSTHPPLGRKNLEGRNVLLEPEGSGLGPSGASSRRSFKSWSGAYWVINQRHWLRATEHAKIWLTRFMRRSTLAIRSCKSSMYLGAQDMVSEGFTAEITGVMIYAFVPHFCRHGRAKRRQQTCPDSLNNLEDPPEHSLESRNGKVGRVSRSCYKCHIPFGGHHLGYDSLSLVTNNLRSSQAHTFHFPRKTRSESGQGSSMSELSGLHTSSGPTDIARLQGLA